MMGSQTRGQVLTNSVDQTPRLCVVVPVRNEANNLAPLLAELQAVFRDLTDFEVIYVNDGSTDRTKEILSDLAKTYPFLRVVHHAKSYGQSAAVRTGILQTQASCIVTLDGDGQNDPKAIPAMVDVLKTSGGQSGLVQGQRLARRDSPAKQFQSRLGNRVRAFVLGDETWDTGCGLRCFWRDVYLQLPYFDALHRFMPALVKRQGYTVLFYNVNDRPRLSGRSNYGFLDRLWIGIVDLIGVWWLIRRRYRVPPLD